VGVSRISPLHQMGSRHQNPDKCHGAPSLATAEVLREAVLALGTTDELVRSPKALLVAAILNRARYPHIHWREGPGRRGVGNGSQHVEASASSDLRVPKNVVRHG